jgi:hypothetical protein
MHFQALDQSVCHRIQAGTPSPGGKRDCELLIRYQLTPLPA